MVSYLLPYKNTKAAAPTLILNDTLAAAVAVSLTAKLAQIFAPLGKKADEVLSLKSYKQ